SSFTGCYLVSLRTLSRHRILLDYWHDQFLPSPPWSLHNFPWLFDRFLVLFRDSAGLNPVLGAALFVAGCRALFLRNKRTFVLLTVPAGVAVLASELHKYPLANRLMLFFVPNLLLL